MRARLDRAAALVRHLAAPEDHLARAVLPLEFEPDIKCIDRAAGKEVPYPAGPHHHV